MAAVHTIAEEAFQSQEQQILKTKWEQNPGFLKPGEKDICFQFKFSYKHCSLSDRAINFEAFNLPAEYILYALYTKPD